MVLADDAYACLSGAQDPTPAAAVTAAARVAMACEALRATTRLMHVIAWLLHQRALLAGEPGAGPDDSAARLEALAPHDPALAAMLPEPVQRVLADTDRLFDRVQRLDAAWRTGTPPQPVQALIGQIAARI